MYVCLAPLNSSLVVTNTADVWTSDEIRAETLQCPLPEPSRVYPFCQENVVVR